ncbi:MAG: FAD-binding oxidoreductase [Alphaproteobacteria bacterium]|nr:FAD-binding oxidoreductase [Alphaproteobacteria bacterium]
MTSPVENYIDTYYMRHLDEDVHYPTLSGVTEADVCVIGGGLAGINTALGLVERGKNIVLIEAKRIGWGASGRNAGFVAKGYAAGESSLAKTLGLEKAQALVELTKNARKLIKKRISEFNIDCGPVIDGVLTVSWRNKAEALKKYINEANDNFGLGFEFWSRDRVQEICKTDKYYDGIFAPHDFQFNPLRYVRGLGKAIANKGGKIFENSPALKIEREGASWVVHTAAGKVKAKHVVLCCAIYMEGLDRRLENAAFPVQTYIMTTAPIEESVLKSAIDTPYAIYDTRFCSDYYRILPDNRLLWGGRVGLWAHPKNIAEAMLHDMFKLYPQLEGHVTPEVSWAGLLCYAPHKMPQIGQIEPGYWYNTGYGGHGLCPTTAGGEIVAAAIAEGDQSYKAFSPFGISYAGGKLGRYAAQMVYWWWRARDAMDI